MKNLLDQLEIGVTTQAAEDKKPHDEMSEERGTLLHIIETFNRNIIALENHPIRKVRETLDGFARELVNSSTPKAQADVLFRVRQWFSSYRVDEYSYIQNTFDDFKSIIWDFADQLAEDVRFEKAKDTHVKQSLEQLREAVESNSIETLRKTSRSFINTYIETQAQKDERRVKRVKSIQRNLGKVKKQLFNANKAMLTDHLTGAYNRRSFEEQAKRCQSLVELSETPASMIIIDIDHFKKINDSYGHDIGDFVLKELVKLLGEVFSRTEDMVCRLGGEEFVVLLPGFALEHAAHKAEEALVRIRKDVLVQDQVQISFTASMGVAQLYKGEPVEQWLKRADTALYSSKHNGRNRVTLANLSIAVETAAS